MTSTIHSDFIIFPEVRERERKNLHDFTAEKKFLFYSLSLPADNYYNDDAYELSLNQKEIDSIHIKNDDDDNDKHTTLANE